MKPNTNPLVLRNFTNCYEMTRVCTELIIIEQYMQIKQTILATEQSLEAKVRAHECPFPIYQPFVILRHQKILAFQEKKILLDIN